MSGSGLGPKDAGLGGGLGGALGAGLGGALGAGLGGVLGPLADLAQSLNAVIYVAAADPRRTPLFVTPAVHEVLGWSAEEWLADPGLYWRTIDPVDRARVERETEGYLEHGRGLDLRYRRLARDGRLLWFRERFVTGALFEGGPPCVQGVMLDASELGILEETLSLVLAARTIDRALRLASGLLARHLGFDWAGFVSAVEPARSVLLRWAEGLPEVAAGAALAAGPLGAALAGLRAGTGTVWSVEDEDAAPLRLAVTPHGAGAGAGADAPPPPAQAPDPSRPPDPPLASGSASAPAPARAPAPAPAPPEPIEARLALFLPLELEGRTFGALVALSRARRRLTRLELRVAESMRAQGQVALERAALVERLERLSSERAELSRAVLRAQEDERRRLARTLHDLSGQMLTAALIRLDGADARVAALGDAALPARRELDLARQVVASALDDLRRLSHDLRPPALDQLGLAQALEEMAEQLASDAVTITARVALAERLPPEDETLLFRVAQSALTNAVRHAGARAIALDLAGSPAEVVLRITDDGRGLPDPAPSGLGLLAMRERAEERGAAFSCASAPGGGTAIEVRLPRPA